MGQLEWKYHVVGTPEFLGPPKTGLRSFVPPVPASLSTPDHVPCNGSEAMGEFEAFIDAKGVVREVQSHHAPVAGNRCQKRYILPIIRAWKFAPATFAGKPTSVYLWVGVSEK
ncbi:hypothetical protein PY254_12395 [Rhodanobacter sp. AS-Z3]|uniref:hypothetical protein n=1 Tax=Rhodanobacter sp. AS-Z3 TaxID=3031330 RepID=UPI002479EF29|nr:hypothetical protein [Rhodanobacter sp. AS-Z3]WEN14034.1 hypothetical protein PY254_12395 [Rhodanobacter sp. AS-Z3]